MEIEATELAELQSIAESTLVEEMEIDTRRTATFAPPNQPPMTTVKPRRIERPAPRTSVVSLEWPLVSPAGNRSSAYLCVKRTLDFVGGLLVLALLSPLLLATLL